jgi:hypothetical protein
MITVQSTSKKAPFIIKRLEKKSKETKEKSQAEQDFKNQHLISKISKRKSDRIRYHIRTCTSNIREAHEKSSELYEILKNISHASTEKDEEINEIYETIQSVYTKLEGLGGKYRKNHIEKKIQLIEETVEDLQRVARLIDNLIQTKEKYKLKNIEEKLQEIKEGTEKTLINFLYIKSNDSSDETAIQKVMDIKEARLQAQREENLGEQGRKQYVDRIHDIVYAKNFAIETIKKLMPLCEKLEISLPETLTKISEVDEKPSIKNVKPILELLLENMENITTEMKNKNLDKKEVEEKKRGMEILKERLKTHHFRVNKHESEELEELKGLEEKKREIEILEDVIKRYHSESDDHLASSQLYIQCKNSSTNFVQRRYNIVRCYLLRMKNIFENLEEACKTLQKSLSCESGQYKEIQEIKKNIENKKLIAYNKIKKPQKKFRDKFPYFEEVRKIIKDIAGEIQEVAEKENKKEEIKLEVEVSEKLMLEMDKFYFEIIILTNETDKRSLNTKIEKKLEEIDPGFKDRKEEIDEEKSDVSSELEDLQEDIFLEENYGELSLKSQESDEYINESLSDNPIEKLKTHIDHDPMEQEWQSSIKIKTTSKPKISKKHDISPEIDFSEASKSSDDNSDEDLYDRGPSKKVKKKNYVESNYIEEDEL